MPRSATKPLAGACILAVEDNFWILVDLKSTLLRAGALAVKACTTLEQAAAEIDAADAGVFDVRIGTATIAPIAAALAARNKPFIFYTGQVSWDAELARWPNVPVVTKPAPPELIVKALAQVMCGMHLQTQHGVTL